MIVGLLPSHCPECGWAFEYKRVNDAPHGKIFACINSPCILCGQWHKLPELRCERYAPIPFLCKRDAA
jgi:hypothetical protein